MGSIGYRTNYGYDDLPAKRKYTASTIRPLANTL